MTDGWTYEHDPTGSARFVLGTVGVNPLVCIGINPSTAAPNAPDRTIARVMRFAADNGFDSWTMLNVYPQISTDPQGLHTEFDGALKAENERHIARMVQGRPTLLAAWGGLIASRPYLRLLLRDILQVANDAGCEWMSLGDLTKNGHPRHPLYVRADAPLRPFDVDEYLRAWPGDGR